MHIRCDMRFENGEKKVLQKAGSKPVLCPILTPSRLLPPSIGIGLGVGEGLELGNTIAISTKGGNNLAGVENGHNTGSIASKRPRHAPYNIMHHWS